MEARFPYKYDKRSRWLVIVYIAVIAGLVLTIFLVDNSNYTRAWLLSILGAVVALYILSIPRYVKVDDDSLEIHCVVEMTRIDVRDILEIRKLDGDEYHNRIFCLLGSYGFFGYYGYYFDFRDWELIKVYATERNNLVQIEDVFEQKYLVSCRDCEGLINAVMQAKIEIAGQHTPN